MKKLLQCVLVFVIGIGIGVGGAVILQIGEKQTQPAKSLPITALTDASVQTDEILPSPSAQPVPSSELLLSMTYQVASLIKTGDYESLSKLVHPEYGCVFSPYATLNLSANQCFTASQVASFGTDSAKYVWGTYDGSGNPIELTPAQYFHDFVFSVDYTQAPVVGINHIVKTGNSLENIADVFPQAQYVELHFPQLDASTAGGDWCTLRLVFETYNGEFYLTAIVHSQWTV